MPASVGSRAYWPVTVLLAIIEFLPRALQETPLIRAIGGRLQFEIDPRNRAGVALDLNTDPKSLAQLGAFRADLNLQHSLCRLLRRA